MPDSDHEHLPGDGKSFSEEARGIHNHNDMLVAVGLLRDYDLRIGAGVGFLNEAIDSVSQFEGGVDTLFDQVLILTAELLEKTRFQQVYQLSGADLYLDHENHPYLERAAQAASILPD